MIKTFVAAALFTFACNFANAATPEPHGTVTAGEPTLVVASL